MGYYSSITFIQFLWNSIDRCIIKLKEWRVYCKSLLQGRASVYEGCYRMHPCVYYLSTRVSENEIGSFRKIKNSACNNSSKILRPHFPENMNSEHLKKINLKNVITYSNLSLGIITVYLENFSFFGPNLVRKKDDRNFKK